MISSFTEGSQHPAFLYNAAASAFLALVVPFTQFVVFPINDELLAENERVLAAEKARDGNNKGFSLEITRDWVRRWKKGDAFRMGLVHLAILAGAIAVFKS